MPLDRHHVPMPRARTLVGAAGLALALVVGIASPATAEPWAKKPKTPSAKLAEQGYPLVPNTIAWVPGTAQVSSTAVPAGTEFTISGLAPFDTKPGTVLTLMRFRPSFATSTGRMQDLGITGTVGKDKSFMLLPTLNLVGTWGYAVGYQTDEAQPRFVGFRFQVATTKAP
jgi:hypothetical protein